VTGLGALAVWPGPALVAWVVAAVATGAPAAPLLVLAVALAPLLALLQPARATAPRHPVTLALVALVAALVLSAHLAALGDAAMLIGAQRWHAIALAATVALLVALMPGARRWPGAASMIGGIALLGVLVAAGLSSGLAPWAAWADAAARPALVFSRESPWVLDGQRFVRRTTLAFDEGQRVVAVTPGTFRVVEHDGGRRVVRDWRLAAGDALTLRPGDTLTVEAGSRVRFEPGKRIPGTPASGPAWGDAAPHTSPARSLALLATLTLGACALVPAPARRVTAAVLIALGVSLGASSWGVYATLAAPEAGLAGSSIEALLSLPRAMPTTARGFTAGALIVAVMCGLLALFVAAAEGLRHTLRDAAGTRWPTLWTAVMAGAVVVSLMSVVDPLTPLMAGLGLAGASLAAPRLAAGRDAGRRFGWPVEVIGALLGGAVFAALTLASPPAALETLAAFPVLVAAPAAYASVRVLRSARGAARVAVR
jgi:hypothetical protein